MEENMDNSGRFGKQGDKKRKQKIKKLKSTPAKNRDILTFEEHRKISPKHPNQGRK
jgi:hypothetical protein